MGILPAMTFEPLGRPSDAPRGLRGAVDDGAAARRPASSVPAPAFGARLRRPGPRVPPPRRPRRGPPRARRVRRPPRAASASGSTSSASDAPHPDLVYAYDPLLVTDRGAIAAAIRQADPARRGGRDRALAGRPRHPDPRPDRGSRHRRRRRHVLAPAGPLLHRPDAAHERRRGAPARRRSSAATSASSTSPTGAATAELLHLLSVISPVADDLAVVYLPLLPVGLWELLGDLGIRTDHRPRRRVPDARLQRPRRAARRLRRGRRQPGDAARARGGRLRGPRLPGPGDRHQRLGRARPA